MDDFSRKRARGETAPAPASEDKPRAAKAPRRAEDAVGAAAAGASERAPDAPDGSSGGSDGIGGNDGGGASSDGTSADLGNKAASDDVDAAPPGSPSGSAHDDDSYRAWKNNSNLLYDVLFNHNVVWPSLCVAWGDTIDASPQPVNNDAISSSSASSSSSSRSITGGSPSRRLKGGATSAEVGRDAHSKQQALYLSSRTDAKFLTSSKRWKGAPNFLLSATVDLPNPRTANYRGIGRFSESHRSSHINIMKRIVHPGEVNKIRMCPQHTDVVATHSDSPLTYVWNMTSQPHRGAMQDQVASVPDLILSGHSDMSEYALSWSKQIPRLISGGSDHVVCMWDLRDAETAGLFQTSLSSSLFHSKVGSSDTAWAKSKTLDAKRKFRGHNDVVEDVAYHPTDAGANLFASVSDDRSLIVWDARLAGDKHGDGVAARLEEAHSDDMNCVDWNSHDVNQIVTGSSDGTIHIYDYRMLASHGRRSIVRRYGHRIDASSADGGSGSDETAQSRYKLGNITNVMWSPTDGRFFASSGDDGAVTIWDASKSGAPLEQDGLPEALLFRHAGHRASIVDFDWNAQSAWTIASLSDDSENPRLAGGTLQVWRITDLLYKGLQEDTKATSEWIDSLGAALSKAEKEDAEKKAGAKNAKQQIVRRDGD